MLTRPSASDRRRRLWRIGAVIAVTLGLLPALGASPAFAAAPNNDNYSSAREVSWYEDQPTQTVAGTNVEATAESGEFQHAAGVSPHHSVWWEFTGDRYGSMTIDTAGSNFDTVMSVQVGPLVNIGDVVASNDDAPGSTDRHSQVTFNVVPGKEYAVAVDGFGTADVGNITLNFSVTGTVPPNDAVANATVLQSIVAINPFDNSLIAFGPSTDGSTTLATTEPGEQPHHGTLAKSVWYRWVPQRSGTADVAVSAAASFVSNYPSKSFSVQAGSTLDAPVIGEGQSAPRAFNGVAVNAHIGVVGGRTYLIAVDAPDGADAFRHGLFTLTVGYQVAPDKPVSISAQSNDASVDLSWQQGSDLGNGAFTRWEVADQDGHIVCTTTSAAAQNCSATGLTNGDSYAFHVRGVNANGSGAWSDWSPAVTPAGIATQPNNPTAAAGNTSATISWDEPLGDGGGFTAWQVLKADESAGCMSVDRATRSCTVTGLTNGTSYQFKVRLVNAAGNGEWSDLTTAVTPHVLTTAGAPAAPTATAGDGQASVAWNEPGSIGEGTFTKWEVVKADNSAACAPTVRATRSCTVTGLTNGTPYQFKVRAVTSAGNGAFSSLSSAVTPQPSIVATAPDSPAASPGDAQATVTWDVPSSMGNGTFTKWEVVRSDGSAGCSTTVQGSRACTVFGLTNGSSYQFKVRAVTNAGNGAWSSLTSAVTPVAAPTVATAPGTPTVTAGDGQAVVNWAAPSSMGNGTFTTWEVQTSSGADACHSNDRLVRSCTVSGLTNGTAYQFKVRAVTSAGNGAFSSASTPVTPTAAATTATAPDSPSASAGDAQAAVTWDVPSSMGNGTFTRWEVARSDGSAGCSSTSQATRNCVVTGLTNGTSYQFKVRAVTSVGNGAWSSLTSPVTPAAGGSTPTTADAPPAPVAKAGNGQVSLKWSAPASMGNYSTFETWEVQTADGSDACHSNDRLVRACTAADLVNGTAYQFKVRAVTSSGNGAWSELSTAVTPEGTAPTATMTAPTTPFSLTPATVSWSGGDTGGSGLASFQVRYTRAAFNAGFGAPVYPSAWQNLSPTTSQVTASTPPGATDCFSVQSTDNAGNVSGWSAAKCTSSPLDDRALTRSSGWTIGTGSANYLSTFTMTTKVSSTLTRSSAQLKRIALVATKCSGCGSVKVQVGSATIATISLNSTTTKPKQLIVLPAFSYRTGTVKLTVTTSGKKVIVDGLGLSRM